MKMGREGSAGKHKMTLVAQSGGQTFRMGRPIEIIASDVLSSRRLQGESFEADTVPAYVSAGKGTVPRSPYFLSQPMSLRKTSQSCMQDSRSSLQPWRYKKIGWAAPG